MKGTCQLFIVFLLLHKCCTPNNMWSVSEQCHQLVKNGEQLSFEYMVCKRYPCAQGTPIV